MHTMARGPRAPLDDQGHILEATVTQTDPTRTEVVVGNDELGSPVEKYVSWVRIRRKKVKYLERLRRIVE